MGVGLSEAVLKTQPDPSTLRASIAFINQASPVQSHPLARKPHGHSLKAEACSFFTAPLNPSYLFSLLLCPLYFSFPFPQFMLFPSVSSFILVKQISLRLLLHCFLYDTVSLVFKSQLTPISVESEPTRLGVVLSVDHWKWSTQNQEGWVCRSSKGHVCTGCGQCPGPELSVTHLSSVLWISAIFLSSFSECLGKNWNLEL